MYEAHKVIACREYLVHSSENGLVVLKSTTDAFNNRQQLARFVHVSTNGIAVQANTNDAIILDSAIRRVAGDVS